MLLVPGEAKRIEVGQQVAAHAVRADQHDHAQMVDDQAPRALAAEIDDLAAVGGGHSRPQDLARLRLQSVPAALEQRPGLRPELVEVAPPARVDGARIVEVAGVEVFDEGTVAAVQEGGLLELASLGHGSSLPLPPPSPIAGWASAPSGNLAARG